MAAEVGITESEIKISNSQAEGTQESTGNNDAHFWGDDDTRACHGIFGIYINVWDCTLRFILLTANY